jgi:hypothetical protein
MAAAATVGLLVDDAYQDPAGLREMFRGHDLVALFMVVPLLTASLIAGRFQPERARLIGLGTLFFAIYNYALYVFGAAFNDLFLVHVGILVAASVAFTAGLVETRGEVECLNPTRGSRRAAAGLLLFLAVGLGSMWVVNAFRFAVTGNPPADSQLVLPIAATHLGYALDLVLIVPSYTACAVLLWRGAGWAIVLAPALLIGGLLQQMTYVSALLFQSRDGIPGAVAFDPGEPLVIAAYAAALFLLTRVAPSSAAQPDGRDEPPA